MHFPRQVNDRHIMKRCHHRGEDIRLDNTCNKEATILRMPARLAALLYGSVRKWSKTQRQGELSFLNDDSVCASHLAIIQRHMERRKDECALPSTADKSHSKPGKSKKGSRPQASRRRVSHDEEEGEGGDAFDE